jgi:hypothetical protein
MQAGNYNQNRKLSFVFKIYRFSSIMQAWFCCFQDNFRQLCQLTEKARQAYTDMVLSLEREMTAAVATSSNTAANSMEKETASSVAGATRGPITGNLGGFEKLFPHLGHSRTPSACSAISIISSVLSEPVSENYPASDPDVDNGRGHESKDAASRKVTDLDTVGESREEGPDSVIDSVEKSNVNKLLRDDFDDGHEADTEDGSESVNSPKRRQTIGSRAGSANERMKSEGGSDPDRPVAAAVKLLHDEHTLDEAPIIVAENPPAALRTPAIDSKRIETWVVESQRAIEHMRAKSAASGNSPDEDADEDDMEDIDAGEQLNLDEEASLHHEINTADNEDDDDAASMKTVDEGNSVTSSKSDYVEACDNGAAA